jgi:hypothetical protein
MGSRRTASEWVTGWPVQGLTNASDCDGPSYRKYAKFPQIHFTFARNIIRLMWV